MRKILLCLLAVTTLTLSGCDYYSNNPQTESSKRINDQPPDDNNYNLKNNLTEALSRDCDQAQEINNYASRENLIVGSNTDEIKYECQKENNAIPNQGKYIDNLVSIMIWFVMGLVGVVLLIANFDKLKALKAGNAIRTSNTATKVAYNAMMFGLIIFVFSLFLFAANLTIQWGTEIAKKDFENKAFKEMSVEIPDFSSKNERISPITEYLMCIRSSDMTSTQNPSLNMFETAGGFGFKATYDRCSLDIAVDTDNKGDTMAKYLDIVPNYKQKQGEAVKAALQRLIQDGSKIANTYSKALHSSLMASGFDAGKLTCDIDSLAAIDTYYFNKRELAKYKAFADDCLSRNFVFELTKAPGFTMQAVDDQEITLGHRRRLVCDGTYEQKSLVSKDEIEEQYKACIQKNCSDLIGSGSPYACSVALNKYFMVKDDRYHQFLMLPASDVKRKIFSNSAEQSVINSFNSSFAFLEKREYYQTTNDATSTINITAAKGLIQRSELEEAFATGDKTVFESITSYDFSTIINHFISADGFAGSTRFITCIQAPYQMKDGFDCGNVYEEFNIFGAKATVLGAQLSMGSMLHSAPDRRKKVTEDIALSGTKKIFDMALGKSSNKVKAYFIPIATDGAAVAADSVFGTKSTSLTGNYPTYYAMMILLEVMPEAGKTLINIMAGALFAVGQMFMYLLQTIELFAFLTIIYKLITEILFHSQTYPLLWMIDIDSPPERRDLDRPAIILAVEKILFLGLTVTSAYLLIPSIFSGVLSTLIGPLNEFSLGIFGWSAGIVSTFAATLISILVVVIIFKIAASLLTNMRKHFESMYFGEMTAHDLRTQGIEEQKAIARAYKGKYF